MDEVSSPILAVSSSTLALAVLISNWVFLRQGAAREVPGVQGEEGEDREWADQGRHRPEQGREARVAEEVRAREEVRPREGLEGVVHEGAGRDGGARVRGDERADGAGEGPLCEDAELLLPLSALDPRACGRCAAVQAGPWGVSMCQRGQVMHRTEDMASSCMHNICQ